MMFYIWGGSIHTPPFFISLFNIGKQNRCTTQRTTLFFGQLFLGPSHEGKVVVAVRAEYRIIPCGCVRYHRGNCRIGGCITTVL